MIAFKILSLILITVLTSGFLTPEPIRRKPLYFGMAILLTVLISTYSWWGFLTDISCQTAGYFCTTKVTTSVAPFNSDTPKRPNIQNESTVSNRPSRTDSYDDKPVSQLVWSSEGARAGAYFYAQILEAVISKKECQTGPGDLPYELAEANLKQGSDDRFFVANYNRMGQCPGLSNTFYCGSGGCLHGIFSVADNGKLTQILDVNTHELKVVDGEFTNGMADLLLDRHSLWIWNGKEYARAGSF